MKRTRVSRVLVVVWSLMIFSVGVSQAEPMSTAFTYQGVLLDAEKAADGLYDLQFKLYDHPDPNVGWQWGDVVTIDSLDVIEGYFTVELDFNDGAFGGVPRWLEIGVRADELDDPNEYTILLPRQKLTPTPYALHAATAGAIAESNEPGLNNKLLLTKSDTEWTKSGNHIYSTVSGNVGIGTTSPARKLHVKVSNSGPILKLERDRRGDATFQISQPGYPFQIQTSSGKGIWLEPGGTTRMAIDAASGNVGIGTTSPGEKLHVKLDGWGPILKLERQGKGNATFQISQPEYPFLIQTSSGKDIWFRPGGTMRMAIDAASGNVGIGTSNPATKLDVAGTTRTQILEITGGADLAEPFKIGGADSVQPGMVVSIDPERIGQLRVSGKAYDRTVAGVISGANGIKAGLTMKQEGTLADGDHPVSLTGRVYCLCDASTGPINPGDLLTTSDTLGHAMKVTDHASASGAILGKARSKLEKGKGLVLILVSLQ